MNPTPSLWRTLLPHLMGGPELPDADTVRAYKIAVADAEVIRLTRSCAAELAELVQEAGAQHFLHGAVQGAALVDSTPRAWLEVQIGLLRAERQKARQEHQVARDRRHAEGKRARPLHEAVSRLSVAASAEREELIARVKVAVTGNGPTRTNRAQELRRAGLSDEEIALIWKPAFEVDEVQAWRARIEVLDGQLAKCTAYLADPCRDPERVRGLGFDDLVGAQIAGIALTA